MKGSCDLPERNGSHANEGTRICRKKLGQESDSTGAGKADSRRGQTWRLMGPPSPSPAMPTCQEGLGLHRTSGALALEVS